MSQEQPYFLQRLTAPKPDWELAIVYAKGVEPMPIGTGYAKVRATGDFLIVDINKVQYPAPDKNVRALADLQIQFHMDEVVRVDFYENVRAMPAQAPPSGIIAPDAAELAAANSGKLSKV